MDSELYFANSDGEVNRFPMDIELTTLDEEEKNRISVHTDKPRTFIGVGGALLTIDEQENTIVASAIYKKEIVENRPFHLITNYTVSGADVVSQALIYTTSQLTKGVK